jgi:hypothetical protein
MALSVQQKWSSKWILLPQDGLADLRHRQRRRNRRKGDKQHDGESERLRAQEHDERTPAQKGFARKSRMEQQSQEHRRNAEAKPHCGEPRAIDGTRNDAVEGSRADPE